MNGYVLMTEEMLNNKQLFCSLIKESFDYICTLDSKEGETNEKKNYTRL